LTAQNSNIFTVEVQFSGDSLQGSDSRQAKEWKTMAHATVSQGPMAGTEADFGPFADENMDDLPRTFRREKEARAREARERAAMERAAAPTLSTPDDFAAGGVAQPRVHADPDFAPAIGEMPYPASVRRFDVPFLHLVVFFLKAVIAAVPAIILLGIILWFAGSALEALFPSLVKMKILIAFPN
jgi:hypothetical protein